MTQALPNLFQRQDTFFGTFEGLGQDFGINPLWLRLAFVAPLFFFPIATIAAYLGLSAVVLATRLVFPDRAVATTTAAQTPVSADSADDKVEMPAARPTERKAEMALAA